MNSAGDQFPPEAIGATGATDNTRRRLTAVAAGVTATLALGGLSAVSAHDADAAGAAAVTGDQDKVVRVSGLIPLTGQVDIGSDTTVLGVGSGSGFTGGGLRLKKVANVVVRNLDIGKPRKPSDGITVQASTRVRVDHNTFSADRDHDKDYYDGLLDLNHGRRVFATAAATAVATSVLALGAAGTASADPASPRHFSTIGGCQTYGNQLAQQGKLVGFKCVLTKDGDYALYIW